MLLFFFFLFKKARKDLKNTKKHARMKRIFHTTMKKYFLSVALAFSIAFPAIASAAMDPFATPPKNMQGGGVQVNSINSQGGLPGIPPPPTITMEDDSTSSATHAAATPMPKTTTATGPNTWIALAIGFILVAFGGLFGFRLSKKS